MSGYSSAQWSKALNKLISMTEAGNLEWEPTDLFSGDALDEFDEGWKTVYNKKIYIVCRLRRQEFEDEFTAHWSPYYELAIWSLGRQKLASARDILTLYNLYNAAKDSFASSSGALDDLLE